MPTYNVTAPDGRKVKLEGAEPPTDAELDEIFASLPPPDMTPEERLTIEERLAQTLSGQPQVGLLDQLGAFSEGALESALAGAPEAVAAQAGLDINADTAAKNVFPQTYEIGKTAGMFVPLGAVGRATSGGRAALRQLVNTANATGGNARSLAVKQAAQQIAKRGGTTGGLFGVGDAISQEAKQEDPDLQRLLEAALLQGGIGMVAGAGLPLAMGGAGFVGERLANILKTSADKNREWVLLQGGGTKGAKELTQRLLPQMRERPFGETFAFTRKGLQEDAAARADEAAQAIREAGPLSGEAQLQPIIDSLEALKTQKRLIVNGKVMNQAGVDHIDEVQTLISQHGDVVPMETLRDIRRSLDDQVFDSRGAMKSVPENSLLKFMKKGADEIRETLAQANPEMAKLNKQVNFWNNLNTVLAETNTRRTGKSSTISKVAAIAGAASAGPEPTSMAAKAALFAAVSEIIQSPAWKLVSAKLKDSLAKSLSAGSSEDIAKVVNQIGVKETVD